VEMALPSVAEILDVEISSLVTITAYSLFCYCAAVEMVVFKIRENSF